jgi:hypothetical protein
LLPPEQVERGKEMKTMSMDGKSEREARIVMHHAGETWRDLDGDELLPRHSFEFVSVDEIPNGREILECYPVGATFIRLFTFNCRR